MRLFHVSETLDIDVFYPQKPTRNDLKDSLPLVWAIDEARLVNFLTPRNCPRVTFHVGEQTTQSDAATFFSTDAYKHVVVVEADYLEAMQTTTLALYEFDCKNFVLQDGVAGYYVSEEVEIPISKTLIDNPLKALIKRNIEVRFVENLWDLATKVKASSLNYSLCRMGFAKQQSDK